MWMKVGDEFADHDKTADALDAHPLSITLWTLAGSKIAKASTDGVVSPQVVARCGRLANMTPAATAKAAAALVLSGLWHDAKTIRRCVTCLHAVGGKLAAGAHYFHDWLDYQFTRDEAKVPEVRWKKARSKSLHRDHRLKQAILDRDLDRCRYCAVRVDFRDRVGPTGGTYDHVDPSIRENTFENVVVACKGCNTYKADRTPTEAGMVLLDPPGPDLPPAKSPAEAGPSLTGAAARGRDGSGRDLAPVKSELVHTNGHHHEEIE